MCSIYVINVGANTSHSSQARSPIFCDNSFQFVSFCTTNDDDNPTAYPKEMRPFTNPKRNNLKTHNDPDWCNMTYGDICSGKKCARGAALRNVVPGDILLFWGLLYKNECPDRINCSDRQGACWKEFSCPLDNNKGWYLFGAMRVEKVVLDKDTLSRLSIDERCRIKKNAHFRNNRIPGNHWIFLGDKDKKHSWLFDKAVELWVPKREQKYESNWESSLIYKTFRPDKEGLCLSLKKTLVGTTISIYAGKCGISKILNNASLQSASGTQSIKKTKISTC